MSINHAPTPTASEETPEQKAARERQQREGARQDTSSDSFLRSIFAFFGLEGLYDAIVAAFSSSGTDSVDGRLPAAGGRERATTVIQSLGNDKLRELAERYRGRMPEPISPFRVEAKIRSHFGNRDPVRDAQGKIISSGHHDGIDMVPVASNGRTEIISTMPGVVVRSLTTEQSGGYGNFVEVATIDGKIHRVAHLEQKGPAVGQVLHQGDLIGIMGSTGHSTGPHLHYEWRDTRDNPIAVVINGKSYGHNDRSYVGNTVAPADPARLAARAPRLPEDSQAVAFQPRSRTSIGATR